MLLGAGAAAGRRAPAGLRARCPMLAEARQSGTAIRNRGTVGGSLAHADPAAELPALALALDAECAPAAAGGTRTIAGADFFVSTFIDRARARRAARRGRASRFARPRTAAASWSSPAATATSRSPASRHGSRWTTTADRRGRIALLGVGATAGPRAAPGADARRCTPTAEASRRPRRRERTDRPHVGHPRSADYRRHVAARAHPARARARPRRGPRGGDGDECRVRSCSRQRRGPVGYASSRASHARRLPPRRARPDRHARRLRARRLRRVHDPAGRSSRPLVPHARRAGGRSRLRTVEGLAARRPAAPDPAGVLVKPRAPVRLLHPRLPDDPRGVPPREPRPHRGEIREALSGNLCRCTGYQNIVDAVRPRRS